MAWFTRSAQPRLSPAEVGIDPHCHLLPGVDDGVADTESALQCLGALRRMGYRGAVLTPHIYPELFDNDEAALQRAFDDFHRQVLAELGDFELALAAEYYCEGGFARKIHGGAPLLGFGREPPSVLMELGQWQPSLEVEPVLCGLRSRGFRPIVAHVERYPYADESTLGRWREAGALLQMNVGSPVDQYGGQIGGRARWLWKRGWVDLLGTDLHGEAGLAMVRAGWAWLQRRAGSFDPRIQRALSGCHWSMSQG